MATIYVSSTYNDLIVCRQSVRDALCRMGHHVIAMEHYVATDQRPCEKCLADVATSHLYIGIFAWRYGYIPPDGNPDGRSITELEYRHALKTGKSCLLFLLHEDAAWPPKQTDTKTGEGKRGAMIQAFREELAEQTMVSYFHTAQELAERVSQAVANWERQQTGQSPLYIQQLLRQHYLKEVLHRYSTVKLPIGPQEGFSLHALFQPLKLLRDPLAAEDLEQEKRRSLLGEISNEADDDHFLRNSSTRFHRDEERGPLVQEVTATDSEDALKKSPQKRLIILGGPGTGKTTTLHYLVSRRAEEALADPNAPLPLFLSLADFARSEQSLKSYLTLMVDDLQVKQSYAEMLWDAIEEGNAFLCMDSLDEVEASHRARMITFLNRNAAKQGNTWVIGSRFTEYKGGQFKQGQFAEWELQPMSHVLRQELAHHLFAQLQWLPLPAQQGTSGAETFVAHLEQHSQAAAWGENPLLFSLAAVVFAQQGRLPASRAMLYHDVLEAILTTRESDPLRRKSLQRIVTELALWLHQTKGRTFTSEDLLSFFADVKRQSWGDTEDLARRLIRSGVLDIVAKETYGFRHQTFQEYLAAVELSRCLTSRDPAIREQTWNFVRSKHKYSRWTEVFRLMAGTLVQYAGKKGTAIAHNWLQELAHQRTTAEGDPGLLGLKLAVISLNELAGVAAWQAKQIIDLEREIVAAWIEELLQAAHYQQRAKQARLTILVREVISLHSQTLQYTCDQFTQALHNTYGGVRTTAAQMLGYLGEYAPIEALLATALHDEDYYVYRAANRALGQLGERVPLDPLLQALQDTDKKLRSAAARTLGALGERAPLDPLLHALQDKEEIVRGAAAGALGQLGERAPLLPLLHALQDKEENVRAAAAGALGQLGERTPLDPLLQALQDKEENVRAAAAGALGQLGERTPLDPLLQALQDTEENVRCEAAEALGQLGERVPHDPLLDIVLRDRDSSVRRYAAEALGLLRKHIPQHILFALLQDMDEDVRDETAKVLGLLKKYISFDPSFLHALQKERQLVRRAAAEMLGHLGELVALEPLLLEVQDNDWLVRRAAVEIIGLLGYLGGWVPLEPLLTALQDKEWSVRYTAAEALSELGERVLLAPLLAALYDENEHVRRMTAIALRQIKEQVPPIALMPALQDKNWEVRRNALGILGHPENSGECIPIDYVVTMALSDKNSSVRMAAARVLQRQKERVPLETFLLALQGESKELRSAAVSVLGYLEERTPIEPLIAALQDEERDVRSTTVFALGQLKERTPLALLLRVLQEDEETVRISAVAALGGLGKYVPTEPLIEPLVKALQDEIASSVRYRAARALGQLGEVMSIDPLITALQDKEDYVRFEAARALGQLGKSVPIEPLVTALQDEMILVRGEAARTLGRLGEDVPLDPLLITLQDKDSLVRHYTVQALGQLGARVPAEVFVTMLSDEAPLVRIAALDALKHIAPERLDAVKAEAKDVLLGNAPLGTIFGSLQQGFIADVLGGIGDSSPEILAQLTQLLSWPHWQVRAKAARALGNIRRSIPDPTIHRLLELRRDPDPQMQAVREAADDALAEILSLETGIEDD